jgi:hypothetical protein
VKAYGAFRSGISSSSLSASARWRSEAIHIGRRRPELLRFARNDDLLQLRPIPWFFGAFWLTRVIRHDT